MMKDNLELVFFPNVKNLEGPIWDEKRNSIWCVAIEEGLVYSVNIESSFIRTYNVGAPVGRYFYDVKTGEIKFDKYVISIESDGLPDGMCIDSDDKLYVAEWEGCKVCKWNPESGNKILEIDLPVKNVSSCCIGGKKMDTLFITTAKHDDGTASEPMASGLFRFNLN